MSLIYPKEKQLQQPGSCCCHLGRNPRFATDRAVVGVGAGNLSANDVSDRATDYIERKLFLFLTFAPSATANV